jgi:hypothetical protein
MEPHLLFKILTSRKIKIGAIIVDLLHFKFVLKHGYILDLLLAAKNVHPYKRGRKLNKEMIGNLHCP